MKRILLIISILLIAVSVSGMMLIGGKPVTVVSSCPSYYASAILSWDGDHTSGVLNACDSSGNAVLFTDGGANITTDGDGGSYALKMDDAGEDITLTQSVGQYFNEAADVTLCTKIKVTALPDNTVIIFQVYDAESDDGVNATVRTDRDINAEYLVETETGTDGYANSADTFDLNTWEIFGYSWQGSTIPNGALSVNHSENATWADGWNSDADIDDAMTDRPIYIKVGSVLGDPGDTEIIYIDEWALFSGNQVNCSTYMSGD